MRWNRFVSFSTLSALVMGLVVGCGQEEVKVADAPAPTPVEAGKPVPKSESKGGGKASSGNMGRNPGADPLKKD